MKRVCRRLLSALLSLVVLVPQIIGWTAAETADLSSPSEAVQAMRLRYGKTYYLRNKKSGTYLDLYHDGTTNGTHFQLQCPLCRAL